MRYLALFRHFVLLDCADFNVSVRGAAMTEESGDVPTYSYNDTVDIALDMSYTCDVMQEIIAWNHFKYNYRCSSFKTAFLIIAINLSADVKSTSVQL